MRTKFFKKPLWQVTIGEFLSLLNEYLTANFPIKEEKQEVEPVREKRYVYGIPGIAALFNCSLATANRIKKSGKIDDAIMQTGRKIVVDADLALKLVQESTWQNKRGRRMQ